MEKEADLWGMGKRYDEGKVHSPQQGFFSGG